MDGSREALLVIFIIFSINSINLSWKIDVCNSKHTKETLNAFP